MKLRTVGSIMAGALMLGATLAGAVASADVPGKEWFIDPATGQPNVVIVVGAGANASDVVSASIIAGQVGNMATIQTTTTVTKTGSAEFDGMGEYNYTYTPNKITYGEDKPAVWYVDFELYGQQYWETVYDNNPAGTYDTTVAIAMPKDVKFESDTVAKGLSTLWFSNGPKEWDSKDRIYYASLTGSTGQAKKYWLTNKTVAGSPTETIVAELPAYAGGAYDNGNGGWDFDYAFYTTKAWVDVDGSKDFDQEDGCDYIFGGTGTGMEAHEEIQVIVTDLKRDDAYDGKVDLAGDKGSVSGIVYRTAEIRYPLLENGQNICGVSKCDGMVDFETARKGYLNTIVFLGKAYNSLFAGATYEAEVDEYLGGYFFYGKPYADKEKILRVGDVFEYHGWTVNLNDVNIYENKAFITVSGPALTAPFSFIMVMDSLDKCGPCCPDCAIYGGGGAFTSNPTNRNEYDPYLVKTTVSKTIDGYDYTLFKYTNFMLDGIKTFVGADGTYLAEFNLYAIEDYGYIEDKGCCDPFVTTPNDYGLAITGGWRKVAYDTYDRQETPYGWVSWEDTHSAVIDEGIKEAYILWQPEPSYYACPDANFDTLELQLCDTIKIPDCETAYTVNGPENYFKLEIVDIDFGKDNTTYDKDFTRYEGFYGEEIDSEMVTVDFGHVKGEDKDGAKIKISQTVIDPTQSVTYTQSVAIDPIELIKLDIEINTNTNTKNLLLVGGPVYNSIVKDLQNIGESTVKWATSPGEWEWIADPYGKGYDVLIVAGANREETKLASVELVGLM
jgi:hypothetical protein